MVATSPSGAARTCGRTRSSTPAGGTWRRRSSTGIDEGAGLITYPPTEDGRRRIREAVYDMQAAVRWVRTEATARRLDPGKVSVGGYSAGAVMSVVTANQPRRPGRQRGRRLLVSGVHSGVEGRSGDRAAVGPGDAGALYLHGDLDTTVPYQAAVATYDAMVDGGLPTKLSPRRLRPRGAAGLRRHGPWLYERMVQRTRPCGEEDPTAPAFVRAAYRRLPRSAADIHRTGARRHPDSTPGSAVTRSSST